MSEGNIHRLNKARGTGQAAAPSALLKICDLLMAQADHVATSDRALEIQLSDGGNVYFLSDPEGGFCAGGITDDADPSMKKQLTAEMVSLGRPLFFIDPDKGDGVAELTRLYAKEKQA